MINQYAERFGKPKLEIRLDKERKILKEVDVVRDTPAVQPSTTQKPIGISPVL